MTLNSRRLSGGNQTSSRPPQPILETNCAEVIEHQPLTSNLDSLPPHDSRKHEKNGPKISHTNGVQGMEDCAKSEDQARIRRNHSFSGAESITIEIRYGRPPSDDVCTNRINTPVCMLCHLPENSTMWSDFQQDILLPPVTVTTLQELDLYSIQNNLNLRIDICYDHELFFQPISGRKGEVKRMEARKYWSALMIEFWFYMHNAQAMCRGGRQPQFTFQPQLPAFFDNLRDVVQMLVPDSDHQEVINHLDTELLMQQVHVGVLDAIGLTSWLINLLTLHCAPMRDSIALAIVDQVRLGSELADMSVFVAGLEKLFGLLEAMKLDIANHQIRSFRQPLIEGAVEFQRRCFTKAVQAKEIDLSESQRWYRMECFNHRYECSFDGSTEAEQNFECFLHALVHLCTPNEQGIPLTLQYDRHRILRLQEDLQDHIQVNLCLAVFNQRGQEIVGPHCDSSSVHDELKERIVCLAEDDDGNGGAISDYLDVIGVEITRAAYSIRSQNSKPEGARGDFDISRTVQLLNHVFQHEEEHKTVTKDFLATLEARVTQFTNQFQKMTTLEVSNSQRDWAQAHSAKDSILSEWDELARKVAHIAVIHWRVWGDLCYNNSPDINSSTDELVLSNLSCAQRRSDRVDLERTALIESYQPPVQYQDSDSEDLGQDVGKESEQGLSVWRRAAS